MSVHERAAIYAMIAVRVEAEKQAHKKNKVRKK